MTTKTTSKQGEDYVCLLLVDHDHKVPERNWRCKAGEVSFIFMDGGDLVFANATTAASGALPEDGIPAAKRKELEQIAVEYLFSHDMTSTRVRFDAFALVLSNGGKAFVRHHKDVFGVS